MKNLKKVLALVLAFACAFTMFAGALTFSDVKPGDDYSAAITMLSDLEVISGDGKGNYNPNGTITRAEACVLIANMMNGGKADTARFAGGSNFSDVPKTYWGESAIAYCVQNGVTYGVGGGKFAPTRQITDAEFVAMVTRAMGYDTAANPLSFPYGNYTAAVNNGIVDNVPYVEGSDCTRGEAAQIIYDCLFADYARYTANQNVIHNSDDDHDVANTLIEVVFGLARKANDAVEDCTQHYWVIVGESCEDDDVIFVRPIDDNFKGAKSVGKVEAIECSADVSALIGYKVVLWGENEHAKSKNTWDVDVVKAVETVDDQVAYDFNPTMDLEDDLDLKDKEVTTNIQGIKVDELEEKNGNSYVLIDWDNDGDIDYINTTERVYGEVTALTSKKIVVKIGETAYTMDLKDGETKDFECEFDALCDADEHDYVVELGDKVEKGDYVEVTYADAYDATVTVTIEKVEPTTKEFTKWNAKGKIYFDDEAMEQAGDDKNDVIVGAMNLDDLAKADVGTDYDVWTNANGYVIAIEEAGSSSDGYLMVLGVADGKYVGVASKNTKASMEVMYTDGNTGELDLAFDAEVPEYDNDKYEFGAEAKIVGGVFEYTLDDDGDIDELIFVKAYDRSYSYDADYETIKWANNNSVYLTGDDFIFVVDKDYVDYEKTSSGNVYTVDEDKVAVIALDDLDDIDDSGDNKYGIASKGAYDGYAVARTETYNENQNASKDYVDGVVFVVNDLDAYLDTKTTKVGLITNITYTSKEVYEFEMYLDGEAQSDEYTSVKVEKDETAKEIAPFDKDAEIIEAIADAKKPLEKIAEYGRGLYAAVTFNKDGKICEVELLVEPGNNGMEPKKETDSDYYVARGVVTETGKDSFRVYNNAAEVVAASDKKIATIDEYKDVDTLKVEYTDDMFVYTDAKVPGMEAGIALKNNIAFHKDSEFSVGDKSDVVASQFSKTDLADIYSVVDVIYEIDDDDTLAVGVFAFNEVEEDTEYVPYYTDYAVTADTTVAGSIAVHLWKVTYDKKTDKQVGDPVQIADVEDILDNDITVSVKRKTINNVGDDIYESIPNREIENATKLNAAGDIGLFLKEGYYLADGDKVIVTVAGYGSAPEFTFNAPVEA